jgi:hypothetical protein
MGWVRSREGGRWKVEGGRWKVEAVEAERKYGKVVGGMRCRITRFQFRHSVLSTRIIPFHASQCGSVLSTS